MDAAPAITTRSLRKEYDNVTALAALDLEVPAGEIFGLIGPNGAGKTTLLKILATVIQPDFGFAAVAGRNVETATLEVRKSVGFMPDFFALYESVTTEDFLTYFGLAFGVDRSLLPARTAQLLEAVNLTEKRSAMISELSRGMKQRLVLAKTLVHDPPILLLDEPLSGLDPNSRMEIRNLLRGLREKGKTIVISSHILAELSDFCTSVCILEKGVLKISGPVEGIRAGLGGARLVVIEVAGGAEKACEIIAAAQGAAAVSAEKNTIRFSLSGERMRIAEINAALVGAGVPVISIREEHGGLEDIYFQVSAHEVQ